MVDKILLSVTLLISVTGSIGGEWCEDWSSGDWSPDRMWCEQGCCGSTYNEYCCLDAKTGMIVGIVIGSIAFVALVVSVLVAIFCCCRKSRGRAGHVHNPQPANIVPMQPTVGYGQVGYNGMINQTLVTSGMSPGVQNWQQPPPPPSYGQFEPKV